MLREQKARQSGDSNTAVCETLSAAARSYIATARGHNREPSLSGCRCSYLEQIYPSSLRYFWAFDAYLPVTYPLPS